MALDGLEQLMAKVLHRRARGSSPADFSAPTTVLRDAFTAATLA